MAMRKILVDETNRELCEHGTVGFPMTVNHDDLWAFEGKSVPIHWHNDLEISLPREGEAIYQVYRKSYTVRPGDVLLLNRNVPHSCHSPNNSHARYSTFLARPDFIYGEYGSDVERRCFRPFLQNSAVPCILLTSESSCTRTVIQKLNETEALFDQKTFCYELKIKGLLCEIFGMILCEHQNDLAKFIPANQLELERLEQMLDYLNTHFESVISLQELADQIHLSREVCCRLFKKMTVIENVKAAMLEELIGLILPPIISICELMGIFVVSLSAIQAFWNYCKGLVTHVPLDVKFDLANGLATSLEFKMAAEILKTVLVRDLNELVVLGAVVLLRALLSLLIHFEMKSHR